jgi:hypothetical protein
VYSTGLYLQYNFCIGYPIWFLYWISNLTIGYRSICLRVELGSLLATSILWRRIMNRPRRKDGSLAISMTGYIRISWSVHCRKLQMGSWYMGIVSRLSTVTRLHRSFMSKERCSTSQFKNLIPLCQRNIVLFKCWSCLHSSRGTPINK